MCDRDPPTYKRPAQSSNPYKMKLEKDSQANCEMSR